jgi:hypothetical protein
VVLGTLVPLIAVAQAVSPTGSANVQPVPLSGGAIVATTSAAPVHPPSRRKPEAAETSRISQGFFSAPPMPRAKVPAELSGHMTVSQRLRELDRDALRGTMSLEDYRSLRAQILRGY